MFGLVLTVGVKLKGDIGVKLFKGESKSFHIGTTQAGFFGIKQKVDISLFLLNLLNYLGGAVGGGVVDDEDVHLIVLGNQRKDSLELVEGIGDITGLVIGRDDDNSLLDWFHRGSISSYTAAGKG